MDYKRVLNIAIVVCLLFFVLGIVFVVPESTGLCSLQDGICINDLSFGYGEPLIYSAFFLGIIFVVLRFVPKEVVKWWFYFGVWYVPLAGLWIISTPYNSGAFLNPTKDTVVFALGGIYMAVSVVIILARLTILKLHKKKK